MNSCGTYLAGVNSWQEVNMKKILLLVAIHLAAFSATANAASITARCGCYQYFNGEYQPTGIWITFRTTRQNYERDGNRICKKRAAVELLGVDPKDVSAGNCRIAR